MDKAIIGVDGGGTHTTLVATDMYGNVVGMSKCGGLNYNSIDIEICRGRLFNAVDKLASQIGAKCCYLSIGLSALDSEASEFEKKIFLDGRYPMENVYLNSDAYMGLYATTLGQPGVMLISGTGCLGIAMDKNMNTYMAGGYGYLINHDEGSSYYAASRAITYIIHAYEGNGAETMLTEKLLQRYAIKTPRELIPFLYDKKFMVKEIAAFAEDVVFCAGCGDKIAASIIEEMLDIWLHYTKTLCHLIGLDSCKIGVYGGMFEKNPHIFTEYKRRVADNFPCSTVGIPDLSPALGAVVCWFRRNHLLNNEIVANMRKTGISKDA